MFSRILLAIVLLIPQAFADYESGEKLYGNGTISLSGYRRTIIELVRGGSYYSVIPWMKDYLVKSSGPLDGEMDKVFDELVIHTGVKVFETLPESALRKSRSGNSRYILAKRLIKAGKPEEALNEIKNVSADHSAYPFVAHMKGMIHSNLQRYSEAEVHFKDCVRISDRLSGKSSYRIQKEQLETNRDYCTAGIARAQFAGGQYKKAELTYLDISKDSFVWPEILFEEAWTSYYEKNYNRTLGKLVSYKAPVFNFIFNPEVEVLKGLTYLKMCLYEDAKTTADTFYNELLNPSKELRSFILSHGKDYRYYYGLMADHEAHKAGNVSPMVDHILRSIKKDAAFIEMKGALSAAVAEYNQLTKKSSGNMQSNLLKNIKTVLDEYRTIIGAYVRAGMVSKYAELYSAFQGMSFIKLEVLAVRKERLYDTELGPVNGKRGEVKYIKQNDKQYFWTFNGEFWADELGDYVFALRSEC